MATPDTCPGYFTAGVCIPEQSCKYFMQIPREAQCQFVKDTPNCKDDHAYIQYMEVFACLYNSKEGEIYRGIGIVVAEILLLFLILCCTADCFFAPSLCAVSNMLGLSEQLAGVTLLAFGNSSPDIITTIVGAAYLGPELVLCQLLGGGIFITSIVASSILLNRQFIAEPQSFMRDIFVYMCAIGWLFYAADDDVIELYESLILIIMYVCYVSLVIVDAVLKYRAAKKKSKRIQDQVLKEKDIEIRAVKMTEVVDPHEEKRKKSSSIIEIQFRPQNWPPRERLSQRISLIPNVEHVKLHVRRPSEISKDVELPPPLIPRRRSSSSHYSFVTLVIHANRLQALAAAGLEENVEEERMGHPETIAVEENEELLYEKEIGLFKDFCNSINPIDEEEWHVSTFAGKICLLLQAPIVYLFRFVIPVIDQSALNNGWCKLLNTILCVTSPLFSAYAFGITRFSEVIYIPIFCVVFVVGCAVAYVVFISSSIDKAPRFHPLYAIFGFLVSMQMIYTVAHELVFTIDIISNILVIDVTTLAMTVLAWGNSMGDLVANTALARAGYPRMAWAGCFGSPLMSVLLGAGTSLTFLVEVKGVNHALKFLPRYRGLIANCFFFLFLSLASSLVIVPSMNFQCRRSYGLYLLIVYAMFIGFIALSESGVIHPLRPQTDVVKKG